MAEAEQPFSSEGHPQHVFTAFGNTATLDDGIAMDVLKLWERGYATENSCQGEDDGTGCRYIMILDWLDEEVALGIAYRLGWVDHIVWPAEMKCTCFYRGSIERHVVLNGVHRVVIMRREFHGR